MDQMKQKYLRTRGLIQNSEEKADIVLCYMGQGEKI